MASEDSAAILRVQKANDHYAVLGVGRGVDADAVKRAYKSLALLLHPDRNGQPGAEDAFKKLLEAYVVLSNAKQRSNYDQQAENGASPTRRKTARKASPPTAEEVAAQKELDEMLQRAYNEERYAEWVKKARYEQNFVMQAAGGMMLSIVLGLFGFLLYVAWPSAASGPQALQRSWSAQLWVSTSWLGSLIGRFVLAVVALILVLVAGPPAFGGFVYVTGHLCGWLFDAAGMLGNVLGPMVESYVSSLPARQRTQAGGRRRRR